MITITFKARILSMKRITYYGALCLVALQATLSAQETAAGGQAAPPGPVPTNQPSGRLTPPPDNAPAETPSAAPDSSAPAATTTTTTTAAPASPKLTSREIKTLRQQEIVRRQELVYRANHSLSAARDAEVAANYPEARKDYLFSAEALGSVSRSTEAYAMAAEGLTRVDLQLYDDALKIGDTARAKHLMEEVIKYNPNNKLAQERLVAIDRALANPNDTTIYGNPAVTPGFVNQVNEVNQLFAEAEQFRRTGQWDEATARLRRILGIDPYNITATKGLERINAEKIKYDEQARLETRDERLRQVEERWYEPIINKDSAASPQSDQPVLLAHTNFGLDQKLKDIYLSLDFNNATVEEAANFLSIESKRLDAEHKGVNFIIQPEASATAKPVSVTLNNVPLGEALRYVCQLANVKYKVQDYAISIVPFSQSTDDLIRKTFTVQPNFVAPPSATGAIESATSALNSRPIAAPPSPAGGAANPDAGDTVKAALMAKGVKFPPGASAVYTPTTGELTVVDTADQMELVEELVNAGQAPTLMVRISAKFVEINQTDLNDLTVNTGFNLFNLTGQSSTLFQTPQFGTQLPGALGFSPDGIDQLIAPQTTTLNTIAVSGDISLIKYNAVITALSQKKSADLLSEPFVLTKSGEQGVLEAVRVFPYPISFDPPELVTQSTNSGVQVTNTVTTTPPTVIATTPTDFKRRNVGVRLVVKPQVGADNKTIDLSLFPEVTDFEGFINYGSPIFVANPNSDPNDPINPTTPFSLLSLNQINQPVFNTRRITTKVLVRDNCTVVLGGLIRDDIQNVNDKVPILGDVPLVGRLFQSKAIENTKKNLIIFVSASIYRSDGELLNPPDVNDAASAILTGGHVASSLPPPAAQ